MHDRRHYVITTLAEPPWHLPDLEEVTALVPAKADVVIPLGPIRGQSQGAKRDSVRRLLGKVGRCQVLLHLNTS